MPAQGDPEMWAVRVKVHNLRYLSTMSDIVTTVRFYFLFYAYLFLFRLLYFESRDFT